MQSINVSYGKHEYDLLFKSAVQSQKLQQLI